MTAYDLCTSGTHLPTHRATASSSLSYYISSTASLPSTTTTAIISGEQACYPFSRIAYTAMSDRTETERWDTWPLCQNHCHKFSRRSSTLTWSPGCRLSRWQPLHRLWSRRQVRIHVDTLGHDIEDCWALRHKIQDLIQMELWLSLRQSLKIL